MFKVFEKVQALIGRARAISVRRQSIRELLAEDDRILDDIGYTRGVLEEMLIEDDPAPFQAEAKRRSTSTLRVPAVKTRSFSAGSALRGSAAACGDAC